MAKLNLLNFGKLTLNNSLLNEIVKLSSQEVEGVIQVCKTKVRNSNMGLVIDTSIVMDSTFEATDLAYKVQHNIMTSLMSMLEVNLKSINVLIKDAV